MFARSKIDNSPRQKATPLDLPRLPPNPNMKPDAKAYESPVLSQQHVIADGNIPVPAHPWRLKVCDFRKRCGTVA